MQRFALNAQGKLIEASQAQRKIDYFCIECRSIVRAKVGNQRSCHFFHLKKNTCRFSQKTPQHIATQIHLKQLIPNGEGTIEEPFLQIMRIADVCWHNRKIIFEVQCSSISQEEIARRNCDYQSLGYQVVWILHERRFNRNRVSAAELWLWNRLHYFTNIDEQGRGIIYDQMRILRRGLVVQRGRRLPVHLDQPLPPPANQKDFPQQLRNRPLCFSGDALNQPIKEVDLPQERGQERNYRRYMRMLIEFFS